MRLAVGFRVSEAAMDALGSRRDVDEQIIAIVENDSCAVDADQVVTGCTVGKGNLPKGSTTVVFATAMPSVTTFIVYGFDVETVFSDRDGK